MKKSTKHVLSGMIVLFLLMLTIIGMPNSVTGRARAAGSVFQAAGARAMIQGPASKTLSNLTCRSIQRVFTSGDTIRVRLSNATTTKPVTFNAVYAGIRTTGASTASNVQVFFGGSPSVTVPAGQEVTSDPFTLAISTNQDLAVSIFMAGSVTTVTEGWPDDITTSTYCTAFSGGGNHAADTSGAAFTNALAQEMYWLTAVDVATDTLTGSVVVIGDSITAGTVKMGRDGYNRWTEVLNNRLITAGNPKPVVNVAISGDTCQIANGWALPILDRLQRDVLNQSNVSHVIVLIGTNDIAKKVTSSQLISCLQNIIGQVHTSGKKIMIGTIIPWNANSTARNEVNAWVRNNAGTAFDGMIDFDAAVRDPGNLNNILPAYDCGDHLHPNAAGHSAMGNAVDLALLGGTSATSTPGPSATPTKTPTPLPTSTPAPGGTNFALNKPVTVSSFVTGNPGTKAVDGLTTTYWRSQSSLPAEWITVDLGNATSIGQVKLSYDSLRRPTAYTIQVSTDNVNWTTVYSTTTGSGSSDTISFATVSARYVKMNSTAWANNRDHVRLVEFEIYP